MTYKLFIDDERFPPEDGEGWVIARSSTEAITTVLRLGVPDFISYDHDLGGSDTSMRFVRWLIDVYLDGVILVFPTEYYVHSQNNVGRDNIIGLLNGFIRERISQ